MPIYQSGWGEEYLNMEVTTVKGIIAVTLSIDDSEKQRLLSLPPCDLLQLSKEKVATVVQPELIKDALLDYNGKSVQLIFSI